MHKIYVPEWGWYIKTNNIKRTLNKLLQKGVTHVCIMPAKSLAWIYNVPIKALLNGKNIHTTYAFEPPTFSGCKAMGSCVINIQDILKQEQKEV